MAIADNLNRLIQAKSDLKTAIESKGVEVGDITIDGYAAKIAEIEGGGTSKIRLAGTGIKFGNSNFTQIPDYFDFDGIRDMSSMFNSCQSLESLDVSNWDLSNTVYMNSLFAYCTSLESIDVSNWDVSKVEQMTELFCYCTSLESIDVSNWDVSNAHYLNYMFNGCNDFLSLDLSSWKLYDGVNIDYIVAECTSLESLDISTWDLSKTEYSMLGLETLYSLQDLRFGYNVKRTVYLQNSLNLTVDSLLSVLNGLYDFTGNGETPVYDEGNGVLYLGETNLAKLTEEQISIGTNKGWQVTA